MTSNSDSTEVSSTFVHWPAEVEKQYERVRLLGSGAFGGVWLARPRQRKECPKHGNSNDGKACKCDYVAMKVTCFASRDNPENALKWAEREVKILKELDHPNIMKVVQEFDSFDGHAATTTAADGNKAEKEKGDKKQPMFQCVALSLADGPTLKEAVELGGALGFPLAKLISSQLIGAVAYLHGRAVIHRDIKPDNIILTGCRIETDDACWLDNAADASVQALLQKVNMVLVDFGFAKALSPADIEMDVGLRRTMHGDEKQKVQQDAKSQNSKEGLNTKLVPDEKDPLEASASNRPRQRQRRAGTLGESITSKQMLNQSAVGNLHFAAPEILSTLRPYQPPPPPPPSKNKRPTIASEKTDDMNQSLNKSGRHLDRSMSKQLDLSRSGRQLVRKLSSAVLGKSTANNDNTNVIKKAAPLSEKVADYGMNADAFSIGATIRYMLTGVPPNYNVEEYIAFQNTPVAVCCRLLGSAFGKSGGDSDGDEKKKKRTKRFRGNDKIPRPAAKLVRDLTLLDQNKRCTVRAAQLYDWLSKNGEKKDTENINDPFVSLPGDPVRFLSFVTARDNGKESVITGKSAGTGTWTEQDDDTADGSTVVLEDVNIPTTMPVRKAPVIACEE